MKLPIGDGELGYESRGSGPALVLLHAFPFDRRMWSQQVAHFSTGRRVIAIDLRGFGESPLWGSPTVDVLAEDVVRLLDGLGVAMATVAGSSMGGYVALALAERHPARLAGLVLADTRATGDSEVAKAARADTLKQLRLGGVSAFLDGVPQRMLSRHADPTLRQQVRELCCRQAETIQAFTRAMLDRPDRTALLERIDCPTLVVCGGEDAITPPAEMRALAGALSDGEYVEIAGAGHLANVEAPERFNEAVARFLDAHGL
jgi:3-oxoadipate enol-lactonase